MLEWFTRKTPRIGTPVISFSKIGQITFNQSAARILQKDMIEHVLVGWDPTDNKMAFKSISNKKDPRAYRIRYNDKGNGASFSAKTFLDHAGINYDERKAIPIEPNPQAEIFLEVKIPDNMLKKKSQPTLPRLVEKSGT
jgi:hypothetical protein